MSERWMGLAVTLEEEEEIYKIRNELIWDILRKKVSVQSGREFLDFIDRLNLNIKKEEKR